MTPRTLHPAAWWLWAIALGAAAVRTTNPFLLVLIAGVAWFTVTCRRVEAPWSWSIGSFAVLGLITLVFRLVLQALFGLRTGGGTVLFTLPSATLPDWAAGVSIGGPVTAESMLLAFYLGLQLAVLLICVGAANSLSSPYRLLRATPAVLYEAGVAISVALAFAPLATASARQVHEARRLRGRPHKGPAGLRGVALPVLENALDRSLQLAASMDARGYGRRGEAPKGRRRLTQGALLVGLMAVLVGAYGLLDPHGGIVGLPALAVGMALLAGSLLLGGRTSTRTRYRPDPWRWPEWLAVGAGLVALLGVIAGGHVDPAALHPDTTPLAVPPVPLLVVAAILVAATPAVLTPEARAMITFDHVTFTYPDAAQPALHDVDFTIDEGELLLLVGRTGSGKSTLLGAINGLVPHFSGGLLQGSVTVGGRSTAGSPPRDLADLVGVVGQAPAQGFVTDVVEDELAYTMENLGLAPDAMRRRVEDVLDLLDLHPLRRRPLRSLSSGQQQRVAIGSVLTAAPRALVLDEPTSTLDPGAGEEVLAALTRLVHDLGLTVVLAERRLERVVQYADRIAMIVDGQVSLATPAEAMTTSPVAPPVVQLGRYAGWSPLPLSVRDARRAAGQMRTDLAGAPAAQPAVVDLRPTVLTASGVVASYGSVRALNGVDLTVAPGEVVALMGRNGAGKSTLLHHVAGLRGPAGGRITLGGDQPHQLKAKDLVRRVALVPADPGVLLNAESVAIELRDADRDGQLPAGTTSALLDRLVPGVDRSLNPRDLSEGQRLGLALAVVLGPQPGVLLLDEPTRGLDYDAKANLVTSLRELAAAGHTVLLATHDVELVAEVASRAVVLADGDVVADGPARQVVSHSPIFAPQMAKVFAPLELLTVAEVEAALATVAGPT